MTESSGKNRVDELMNTVSELAIQTQRQAGKKKKLFPQASVCVATPGKCCHIQGESIHF